MTDPGETRSGPSAPRPPDVTLPTVDGYDVLAELGRGSVGVVYKARHLALNRVVALKMVVSGPHAGSEQLVRFATEARAVAALRHPAIVQIHEIGTSNGLPFLSLEYVDGPSLDRHLAGRPQDPRDAARLIGILAGAVHVAHGRGILHRDIKPANVLLTTGGAPKLTDFGLAKDLEDHSSQTRTGTLLGTPSYMAPEQARGDLATLGPAVDIHALGAILYEMLVGRPPFLGTNPYETTMQVVDSEPVPPSRLVGRLPTDVETICLKCLQKDPAQRYADGAALAEDCRRFLAGEPLLARPVSPLERTWRWCRRNPRVAGLAASVVGLLVFIAAGATAAAILLDARRRDADRARESLVAALELAEESKLAAERAFADADGQRVLAEQATDEARRSAKVAAEQTSLALSTIRLLVDKVQRQLGDLPGTRGLKSDLLETALAGLDEIAAAMSGFEGVETTALAARMRLGAIYRDIGSSERALREYGLSADIARRRVEKYPDNAAARANLAAVLAALGDVHTGSRRDVTAALACFDEALAIWRHLDATPPGQATLDRTTTSWNVAEACARVGAMRLRVGDPLRAMPLFEESWRRRRELSRAQPENRDLLLGFARACTAMAQMAFATGNDGEARERYDECIVTAESVVAADADDVEARLELANALGNYGDLCVQIGSVAEGRLRVERSLDLHRELAALDPEDVELDRHVTGALYRLAVIDVLEGRAAAAAERLVECLAIRRRILEKDPADTTSRIEWMLALARHGDHREAAAVADAIRAEQPDPESLFQAARCLAQCSVSAGGTGDDVGRAYADRALEALQTAIEKGYCDGVTVRTDPDLAPLRSHPRFAALLVDMGDGR